MGYEIPQQLAYTEKILFGLTFKQLAYALLFLTPMLLFFFKTGFNIYVKSFVVGFLACFALCFMFFNLDYHVRGWIAWYRVREVKTKEQFTTFKGIKEIKDNLIYTLDNKKLAVLKIEPLNFSIKPQGTQEAIIASFQKFLNSVDFPIQIMMNTESLNLQDYFKELEGKITKEKSFQELFKKYKGHIQKLISENDILNRKFYLIIPEKHDISIQINLCQKKLETIGLKNVRLETHELQQLVEKFFISETASITNNPHYLKINTTFVKTLYAYGYPRNVELGFLDKIVSLLGDFDLSLHIEPYDIETMMIMLNKELQKQRADLYSAQLKGTINPSLEIQHADTRTILDNLQKGKEKLFNVSLYVTCRAQTLKELNLLARRVEAELNSLLIIPRYPRFRMAQAFQSCAPLATNKLTVKRNVPTEPLSAFFPFTSSFLQADKTGIWLGQNKNNIPIIKDIFKLSNPNGFCLASSGSGKSYMAKLMIARNLLHGTKVIVIDPQGEYSQLVERFKGQRIDLGIDSKTIINPLDLMGHEYREKRLALMDLMPIMLGELTEPQKSFIDKAITEAYEKCGINEQPDTWNNQPPLLEDILYALERIERKALLFEKSTIRSLINRLDMYVNGVFSFLNQKTHIDFNNRFVCFDIGLLPKQVKPVMMFLVLDYVYMKMKKDIERKLLVIDEAWSLLSRTEDASYIFEIVKTCRKFNLALFLINQEVEGMLSSEAGKSVLANSSYTLLMRQKPAVIKQIQETFCLSNAERHHLLTAGVGEGILLMDDEHSEIRIVASDEEHKQITTNADELLAQRSHKKEQTIPSTNVASAKAEKQRSVRITVDTDTHFYRHRKLKLDEVKYLLAKKYRQLKCLDIQGKTENFILKPRANEGIEHCFLTHNIAEHLKSKNIPFELYNSVKPDIIFTINDKKYAIEIETGKVYAKDKKKFHEKVKTLNKEYGDNWFFVLTNRNVYTSYSQFGKTYTKKSILTQLNKIITNHEK
ncbi:MAG: ATP-binding protein [Nanoarchaeota archaeon]|nr:ATP-binding protein [Nanoarchaeota archaeon]